MEEERRGPNPQRPDCGKLWGRGATIGVLVVQLEMRRRPLLCEGAFPISRAACGPP